MSFERPSSGVRPTQSAPIDTPRSLAPRIDDIPREDGEFLVESAPSERQLHKAEFLTQLQNVIHEAAGQELTGTAWTAEQCPYIEYWFAYYQRRSASQIEAALRKYAPTTIDARNASDYLPAIAMRVREAVRRWRATGEVDAPPAAIPSPVEIMTSLGPGAELAGPVRSRMENAMHTSFADTRVHVDGRGAQAASEHSARAFAIGNHVAFGSGQYAPGTPVGDAMLAHELAHTVQQRGDASSTTTTRALEHAADRSAFTTMARLWGRGGLATQPTVHAGLSLQRCRVDQSEKTVPEAVETKLPDLPAVADKSGEEVLDPVDFAGWKPANKDALLFVVGTQTGSTEKQLFVLPAREFGVYVPPQPSAPSGTKPDPARRPGLALSASGHSSGLLINAGGGVGFYISVFGTPNGQGQPDMLLARGLQRLETELGITRVEDALVTHLHSDHAGGLVWMVRNHLIRGDRIYAPPGIGDVLAGALAAEAATLATGQVSALFAAGWRPRELTTRQINVNRPVTESTIEIGNTRTVMVVETSKLQAFRDAFASGGWSAATAKADAATPLTHVTWLNTGVEAIDTSDIRGRTIEDLYTALGDTAFRAHIGNARIVYGLHHLGTGLTAKDIRGHMRIFAAMGGGTQPITVIAQTGAPHAVNEAYIEALNIGGVRVVFLEDVDPAKPFANIKVRADGSVVHSGAQERGIRPETRDAQERLARMEAAAEMLERLSDY